MYTWGIYPMHKDQDASPSSRSSPTCHPAKFELQKHHPGICKAFYKIFERQAVWQCGQMLASEPEGPSSSPETNNFLIDVDKLLML